MAKRSAKSKGFRKQNVKKPYLSKREIAVLCVAVAAIAVATFFLFRYDDGALKVQDGAVVAKGDNWLIVNGSNARGRARYFKLGEVGEIDGYTREASTATLDGNVPQYVFTAEAEDAQVQSLTVTGSHSSAQALVKYASQMISSMDYNEAGEPQTAELNGRTVEYYIYTTAYAAEDAEAADAADAEEAADAADSAEAEEGAEAAQGEEASAEDGEAAEAEPNRFSKTISGYIDAGHDSCVVLLAESHGDSAEACASDEALLAALEQAVAAVTLEA